MAEARWWPFGCFNLERTELKALVDQAVRDPSPITRRLAFARMLEHITATNALDIREQLVALNPGDQT